MTDINQPQRVKDLSKNEPCKHKKKYGRAIIKNRHGEEFIERVCCDCGETIDYVRLKCSGVMF